MNEEEEFRKALEAEIIKKHIAELENQLAEIESKKAELEFLNDSLDEVKGQKGKDILVPLGSGVLIKAKLEDDEKVIVNIGSNVLVDRTVEETKKIINEQIKELNEVKKLIENELMKYF